MENEFYNKTIFGKFKLINLIGKGSYSLVFSAQNLIDKSMVAVKIQDKSQIYGNLEKEAYYLYILKGTGIPKIVSYGIYKKYYILVEQLLGKSLQQLFISNTNTNINSLKRKKDIIIASIQVLDRIEFIHSKLILHLDIKPDNFLIEKSDSSLIYVIDFGFAKKYRSSRTGKNIKYGKKGYFNGNLKYASVNTMKGVSPSRRDDLESLGYMIIYLYNQKLPWEDLPSKNRNALAQKIYELKKTIKIENLCINMPEEMVIYMNYVKSLKFEQDPNYNYLRDLFQNLLKKIDRNVRPHFSWINRPLTGKDSDFLGKSYKKRRKSPFSKILNKFMNKSALDAKMPKLQMTNNLKLQTLEKGKEIEIEIEKEKNLTQRMKDFPQMIINNRNSLYIGNSDYNLEKDPINKNEVYGNENLNKNTLQIINKKLEIKKNNIILRNRYNNMLNNYHTKFINTAKNRIPIIDNGNITPSNIQISGISGNQNSFNPSTGNSQKSINYNFVINPYIANKTINIYSNNSSQVNSSSKQQKIMPQNKIKKIIMSKHNSSNNMNKISPKNSFPFNRNASNMYFEITDYKNIEKKNNRPNLGNTNFHFENNITYKRKFGE